MVDEKCHYQRDGHISKTCKWLNILGVGIGVLCEAYIYKAASPLNRCDKRRKNSMSETRTEPRRANPKLRFEYQLSITQAANSPRKNILVSGSLFFSEHNDQ